MYKEYYFKHKFSYQEAFNHLDNTPFIFTINSFDIDKNWYSKTITLWNEKACKYLEDYLESKIYEDKWENNEVVYHY